MRNTSFVIFCEIPNEEGGGRGVQLVINTKTPRGSHFFSTMFNNKQAGLIQGSSFSREHFSEGNKRKMDMRWQLWSQVTYNSLCNCCQHWNTICEIIFDICFSKSCHISVKHNFCNVCKTSSHCSFAYLVPGWVSMDQCKHKANLVKQLLKINFKKM